MRFFNLLWDKTSVSFTTIIFGLRLFELALLENHYSSNISRIVLKWMKGKINKKKTQIREENINYIINQEKKWKKTLSKDQMMKRMINF